MPPTEPNATDHSQPHPSGNPHDIWVNETGTITQAPRPRSDATLLAILTGAAITTTLIPLTDRTRRRAHHTAAIDAAWRQIAPEWRRHHL